mgnify:CR=1 FL=1|tara:strand:+ start:2978 stop:3736 length:759 start_codon:yes stop_codon:yes gene_type:complete
MRSRTTFKKLFKNSLRKGYSGEWLDLGHYLVSETLNIFPIMRPNKKKLKCPLCNNSENQFVHLGNKLGISWNVACPNCDSRSRHRGLFFLYNRYLNTPDQIRILHFAPEESFLLYFKNIGPHYYKTTDFNMAGVDFPNEDIQSLKFDDCSYDIVLANHVLEHVENDDLALSEVARILNKNGKAIFTIPGDWRRAETKIFPNLDLNGHYRDYGLDIIDLMRTIFSKVQVCNLFQFDGNKHAIKKDEKAFICIK